LSRSRRNKSSDESQRYAQETLKRLFEQAKLQFGDAAKGFWFYEDELCPGCLQAPISKMKFKGKDALSLNAFIYRERGILIGYFLCGLCAAYIFEQSEKRPGVQTPLHGTIEQNLIVAYHKHLSSLDA
jgi:hypothetical protein